NGANPRASALTHSAPSRVLPDPRPPTTSQFGLTMPGRYCLPRACEIHSRLARTSCIGVRAACSQFLCEMSGKLDDLGVELVEDVGDISIPYHLFFGFCRVIPKPLAD